MSGYRNPGSKEIKLYNNAKEREMYENMADLYSILKTTEHLEKAFIRDSISASDYNPACMKLIAQYKTAKHLLHDQVPDIQKFVKEYRLECTAAIDRLTKGVVYDPDPTPTPIPYIRITAEIVQNFITTMDSVKLNLISVDALHPLLTDLVHSLNRYPVLPKEYEGTAKMQNWLEVMNKMRASDELNEEQVRQLLFDLETAYTAFHKSIS